MRIVCATQHTADWHAARLGLITGSRVAEAMRKLKVKSKNGVAGDWHGDHWKYVSELAWERIMGVCADHYVSGPMEIGEQFEGEARVEFWMRHGAEVEQTGFVLHPTLNYLGSSPDGYVIESKLPIPVELKVPLPHTHQRYLEEDAVPEEYRPQLLTEMLCLDRAPYGYFASYCPPDVAPELPDEFRLFIKRLDSTPEAFAEVEEAATVTIEHVVAKMEQLRKMYPAKGAPKSEFVQMLEASVLAEEISEHDALEDAADYICSIEGGMTP